MAAAADPKGGDSLWNRRMVADGKTAAAGTAAAPAAGTDKKDEPKPKHESKKPASDIKTWNVKCKISPSLLPNNLSSSGTSLCYISRNERESRNEVHIVRESADDIVNERPAVPAITILPDKDTIAQARFARFTGIGDILIVITHSGIVNIYDESGQKLLHFHKLTRSNPAVPATAKELQLQGISHDPTGGRLFIGAGNGELLVFSINKQKFVLAKKLSGQHKEPVADVAYFETGTAVAPGGVLVSGDLGGTVIVWDDAKDVCTKVNEFAGAGFPVTSIRTGHGFAAVAYASGHIRLIDLKTKKMALEITAHVRCISALDIHPTKPIFAATSEDTYTTIWTLPVATNKKISNLLCASVGHSLFTGIQFCGKYGGSTATTAIPVAAVAAALSATGAGPAIPASATANLPPPVTLTTNQLLAVVGLDTKFVHFLPLPASALSSPSA